MRDGYGNDEKCKRGIIIYYGGTKLKTRTSGWLDFVLEMNTRDQMARVHFYSPLRVIDVLTLSS